MIPLKTIEDLINKHSSLEKDLSSGELDKKLFAEKSKEYSDVNEIIRNLQKDIDGNLYEIPNLNYILSVNILSGLGVNTNAAGSGSAFFYDDSAVRWGLTGQNETGQSDLTATPRQFLMSVSQSAGSPVGETPDDFGSDAATRRGLVHIDSSNGDIYIYS